MVKTVMNDGTERTTYHSLVSPEMMDVLERKILDVVVMQKKFKEKSYTIHKLASDVGTNIRYISTVMSVRFHTNYITFINKHRVDEAKNMLVDRRYRSINVGDIGEMVGFSNRQTFYTAFSKIVGTTPRKYRMTHPE